MLAALELGTVRTAYGATCRGARSAVSAPPAASVHGTLIRAHLENDGAHAGRSGDRSFPSQQAVGNCPGAVLSTVESERPGDAGVPPKNAIPAADSRAGPEVALAPPFHPPRTI